MTENNANTVTEVKAEDVKTEVTPPTAEELAKAFGELPESFQDAIKQLNGETDDHNKKVDKVIAAEAKDPKLIKAEIFEQNPGNNKQLAVLRKEELKLLEQLEKIRTDAYKVIDDNNLMPAELSEDELTKLKGEVTTSTKALRDKATALGAMEDMLPMLKGKLLIHLHEIKTRRGTAKTTTTSGGSAGPKRLRFKRIEINNLIEDEKGNKVYGLVDGEKKFTFTFASMFLRKQHKGITFTANDLTDAYLKGLDEANLPESHEFVLPYTFKDANGNDQTVNFTVKAFR